MKELADLIPDLLTHFGVLETDVRDRTAESAGQLLAELGYPAELVDVRHGVMTLACDPMVGGLLRYDCDRIIGQLNDQVDGLNVHRIAIHSR